MRRIILIALAVVNVPVWLGQVWRAGVSVIAVELVRSGRRRA